MMDLTSQYDHYEAMMEAVADEYDAWLDSLDREHAQYIIVYKNGQYLAYQFVKHIIDGGVIGTFPTDHKEIGFCAGTWLTIADHTTRSFAYAQAIAEWIEDDDWQPKTEQDFADELSPATDTQTDSTQSEWIF